MANGGFRHLLGPRRPHHVANIYILLGGQFNMFPSIDYFFVGGGKSP